MWARTCWIGPTICRSRSQVWNGAAAVFVWMNLKTLVMSIPAACVWQQRYSSGTGIGYIILVGWYWRRTPKLFVERNRRKQQQGCSTESSAATDFFWYLFTIILFAEAALLLAELLIREVSPYPYYTSPLNIQFKFAPRRERIEKPKWPNRSIDRSTDRWFDSTGTYRKQFFETKTTELPLVSSNYKYDSILYHTFRYYRYAITAVTAMRRLYCALLVCKAWGANKWPRRQCSIQQTGAPQVDTWIRIRFTR